MNDTPNSCDQQPHLKLGSRAWPTAPMIVGMVGVLILALAIRLLGITSTDVWADEAVTLMVVRASWLDLLTGLPAMRENPPLAYLLFKAWSLLSPGEVGMRLLPVLLGVGAVAVLMRVGYRIAPPVAIATGLLAAVSPVAVHYSQELRCYSLLFLTAALVIWAAQGAALKPACGKRMVLLSALGALAAHVHSVGLFVYPMGVVFVLVMTGRAGLKALLRPGGVWLWLLLVSPMIWFNLQWSRVHGQGWWIGPLSLYNFKFYAGEYLGMRILDAWAGGHYPRPVWSEFVLERLLILCPAVLAGAGLLDKHLRRWATGLGAAAAFYAALLVASSLLLASNLITRTLLPGWAPAVLLLGVGGTAVVGRNHHFVPRAAFGLLVCLFAAGWVWQVEAGPPRRTPTREMYAWVHRRIGPHDVVVSARPWTEELTAYYLGDAVPCERLLSTSIPLCAGLPPARKMVAVGEDLDWPARLRAALDEAAASGSDYRVWYIDFDLLGPSTQRIEQILRERHRRAGEFTARGSDTNVVIWFVPMREQPRTKD